MTTIDYAFLAVCVVSLCLMLAVSKVLRAVLWETVRYPFQASRIEVRQGHIVVSRSQPEPIKDDQPSTPAGAK